jgi:glyoxylase-like metal-dependent hydrolase (beta-lactamase superfamily II)
MKYWSLNTGKKVFQVLNMRSNSYLISTNKGNILVDTGVRRNLNKLCSNLKEINNNVLKIDFLILTHSHFDHCANSHKIKKLTGCKIIINENESCFLSSGFTPIPDGTNFLTKNISSFGKKHISKKGKIEAVTPEITFSKEFNLPCSDIKLIHTPGHSIGSCSIILNNEIAIVGDTMFGILRDKIFPPYADSIKLMVCSWETLLKTNCSIFLPGHGSQIERKTVEKEYLKYKEKLQI